MTAALTTLTRARKQLSDKDNWTQKAMARDKSGDWVSIDSKGKWREKAVCFCAIGACIYFAPNGKFPEKAVTFLNRAAKAMYPEVQKAPDASMWVNDSKRWKDVITMFDYAIRYAKNDRRRGKR